MEDIFLSYARKDIKVADRLMKTFKEEGFRVWSDKDIPEGEDFRENISTKLDSVKCVVVLWSQNSVKSDFVIDEAAHAQKNNNLLPVLIEKVIPPIGLRGRQNLELLWKGGAFDPAEVKEVMRGIGKKVGKPKPIDLISADQIDEIEKFKEEFKEAARKSFTFLLVGRTGVGKSKTINTLLGKEIAKVHDFMRMTKFPQRYQGEINGLKYSIVDTPGLADTDNEEHDKHYLNNIKKKIARIDCLWFVTPLREPRLRADEIRTIRLISETFRVEVWERAIIVFTCADLVSPDRFPKYVKNRTQLILKEISKHTKKKKAYDIPVVPVANSETTHLPRALPNGKPWLGELYTEVFSKISVEAAAPFFFATARDLVADKSGNTRIPLTKEQKDKIAGRAQKIPLLKRIGAAIKKKWNKLKDWFSNLF